MKDPSRSADEIDLGLVLLKISEVLSNNKVAVGFALIVGLGLGFVYSQVRKPYHESNLVIESRILNYPLGNSLITTLQQLIDEGNHSALEAKLGLDASQTLQLKSFETIELKDVASAKRIEVDPTTMVKIRVQLYKNEILPQLEKGIINYLENNPYVKKSVEIKKENLQTLQKRIRNEVEQLDQLKGTLYQNMASKTDRTNITVIDPANVFKELIELYEAELNTRSQLELIDNIQVIESFTEFKRSIKPNKIWSMLVGGMSGFLIVSLVLFLAEGSRYLRKLGENRAVYQTK
ncbi:MAG: hypothetical protein ACR2MX_08865 [Cyclobacteriaceae bacterium]